MPQAGTHPSRTVDELKRMAAEAALAEVAPDMRLGLGTGSTAEHFIRALGSRVRAGLKVVGVPTSERSAALAREMGIRLAAPEEFSELDLAVDGADELDGALRLIKGGGGALLREKIVAASARRFIVIADGSKQVESLGAFPLPIEVVPFGLAATKVKIELLAKKLGLAGTLDLRRKGGAPFISDGGNVILDASFGRIPDPETLADMLDSVPGVVDHGLFIGLASIALLARESGVTRLSPDDLSSLLP